MIEKNRIHTEKGAFGDFDGFSEATHGKVDKPTFFLFGGVEEVHEQGCSNFIDEVTLEGTNRYQYVRVFSGPLDGK